MEQVTAWMVDAENKPKTGEKGICVDAKQNLHKASAKSKRKKWVEDKQRCFLCLRTVCFFPPARCVLFQAFIASIFKLQNEILIYKAKVKPVVV